MTIIIKFFKGAIYVDKFGEIQGTYNVHHQADLIY